MTTYQACSFILFFSSHTIPCNHWLAGSLFHTQIYENILRKCDKNNNINNNNGIYNNNNDNISVVAQNAITADECEMNTEYAFSLNNNTTSSNLFILIHFFSPSIFHSGAAWLDQKSEMLNFLFCLCLLVYLCVCVCVRVHTRVSYE